MKLMGPTENLLENIACCLRKGERNPRTSLNLLPAFQRPTLQSGRKFPLQWWSAGPTRRVLLLYPSRQA